MRRHSSPRECAIAKPLARGWLVAIAAASACAVLVVLGVLARPSAAAFDAGAVVTSWPVAGRVAAGAHACSGARACGRHAGARRTIVLGRHRKSVDDGSGDDEDIDRDDCCVHASHARGLALVPPALRLPALALASWHHAVPVESRFVPSAFSSVHDARGPPLA